MLTYCLTRTRVSGAICSPRFQEWELAFGRDPPTDRALTPTLAVRGGSPRDRSVPEAGGPRQCSGAGLGCTECPV